MAFEQVEARMQAAVFRNLANCTVVAGASTFRAILNRPDNVYDAVATSVPELRYPSAQNLSDGMSITIDGAAWRVQSVPRRIGAGGESVVTVGPA